MTSSFRDARCVVTGGLGFIGSNVARSLADAGAHVTVIDSLVPHHGGHRRNVEGADVAVIVADIADVATVAPVVAGADFVFSIAGQVSHVASMEDPLTDLAINAASPLALLETLRRKAPHAIVVHTSTRQVYGRPRYLPVDEAHPVEPVDVNGIDKLAGEQFHLLYHRVYGLRACALRLTNVYGPRQRLVGADVGFLPLFIRRALEGGDITVYGEGEQLRDCLHVDDVVAACLAAAVTDAAHGEVFNLGHPEPASLRTIAETIVAAAGRGRVVSVPWPPERSRIDIGSFHGDFSKARRVLGWAPRLGLAAGVRDTVAFFREHAWYLSST